ncbi:kinase-like protein [Apiospora arundinis]|uniref:Kinase-like protein n=1 Tax=Apiospora arundinis TaxID=335852 RepID=A0ABR2JN22_9PEZI
MSDSHSDLALQRVRREFVDSLTEHPLFSERGSNDLRQDTTRNTNLVNHIDSLLTFCIYLASLPESLSEDLSINVSDYQLQNSQFHSKIGRGGSFEVFSLKLQDFPLPILEPEKSKPKVVAVKIPILQGTTPISDKKQWEVRILRNMAWELHVMSHTPIRQSRNVANYYGIFWCPHPSKGDGVRLMPALVMEYADLGTLDHLFNPDLYNLTFDLKWQLTRDIAYGMTALHENRIVHGDLKAQNVLLFSDIESGFIAKVADFGLSLSGGGAESTAKAVFKGYTVPWEAPEVDGSLIHVHELAHADIYSFGLLVWRLMLEGQTFLDEHSDSHTPIPQPFQIRDMMQNQGFTCEGAIKELKKDTGDIFLQMVLGTLHGRGLLCDRLNRVCTATLRKNPTDRAQTFLEILEVLAIPVVQTDLERPGEFFRIGQREIQYSQIWNEISFGLTDDVQGKTVLDLFRPRNQLPNSIWREINRDIEEGGVMDHGASSLNLALCHFMGFGTDHDQSKGLKYMIKAASEGDLRARAVVKRIHDALSYPLPDSLPIHDWIFDAARHGSKIALSELAVMGDYRFSEAKEANYRLRKHGRYFRQYLKSSLTGLATERATSAISQWFQKNQDLSSNDYSDLGWSRLHVAAVTGNLQMINALLEGGNNIDECNWFGETALLCACRIGDFEVMRLLLEKGAQANKASHIGQTPMHFLIFFEEETILPAYKLLSANGSGIRATSIPFALTECEIRFFGEAHGYEGTPLHWAVQAGCLTFIKLLLEDGADPLEGNGLQGLVSNTWEFSNTPLDIAVDEADATIVEILLSHPGVRDRLAANPQQGPDFGAPMRSHDFIKMCRYGSSYRAQIAQTSLALRPNREYNELMGDAIFHYSMAFASWLIEQKCDVNRSSMFGLTPLQAACTRPHPNPIASRLLGVGADPTRQTETVPATALNSLISNFSGGSNGKLIQDLIVHGCDPAEHLDTLAALCSRALKNAEFHLTKDLLQTLGSKCRETLEDVFWQALAQNNETSELIVKYILGRSARPSCVFDSRGRTTVFQRLAAVPEDGRNDKINGRLAEMLLQAYQPKSDVLNAKLPYSGMTALVMCVNSGNYLLTRSLLLRGASLYSASPSVQVFLTDRIISLLEPITDQGNLLCTVKWARNYRRKLENTVQLAAVVVSHLANHESGKVPTNVNTSIEAVRGLVNQWQRLDKFMPEIESILKMRHGSHLRLRSMGQEGVILEDIETGRACKTLSRNEAAIVMEDMWERMMLDLVDYK